LFTKLGAKDALGIDNDPTPTEIIRVSTDVTVFQGSEDIGIDGDITASDIASGSVGGDTTASTQYQG
jgi:hypothetical protein